MRALLAALLLLAAAAAPAQAAPRLVPVGDFDEPVHVTGSPQDSHRLFVVERRGRVQITVDGQRRAQPFLDIAADTLSTSDERGLLSIAFPSDYQSSRRFYVYLTAQPGGQVQVREYLRSATDPDRADPATGRTLLAIDHPRSNHNGGQLQFGPDGRLWIGTGDGGGRDDTDRNAQNPSSPLGKLLRLDPLLGGPPEIFAIGLRNPWRFSFDRATGDLVIADVGQGVREEIDVAPAPQWRPGANYGWPCWEGTRKNTDIDPRCDPPGHVAPVHERTHGSTVCSITGGYVVRDPGLPTLRGRYLYGDLCDPQLRSLALGDPSTDAPAPLSVTAPTSFGEDVCGRLYVASLNGPVSRIEDGAATPCAVGPPPSAIPPPPPGGSAADTRRPALRVRVRGRRSLARRARLRVVVRSDEDVTATVTGRLRGGVGRFRTARVKVAAGRARVVKLRLRRAVARRLRRALGRKRVVARISVTVGDAAGNRRRAGRRVVVPRRR